MKAISLSLILMSLCLSRGLKAEEPAVSVYQIIKPSLDTDSMMGVAEVILKVTNPTEKTFFVLGNGITDIPHIIETKKKGKWIQSPSRRCGTGMTMRKFLPHSSIVFDVWDAPLIEEDVTFRVRVYLYTEPDVWNFYKDPAKKPFIEILSQEFSSNDFKLEDQKMTPEEKALRAQVDPFRLPPPSKPLPMAPAMGKDPFGDPAK